MYIYIYRIMQKKSTNHEPYTTSTQWMESWNSIENASRIMLRPWLQKRINHFYRDRGRENNNHREGIYHERKRIAHGRAIDTAFIFFSFRSVQKSFLEKGKKKNRCVKRYNTNPCTNDRVLNLKSLLNQNLDSKRINVGIS